jgi:hypothetical protein
MVRTLDFTTGQDKPRCYTGGKIIDMIFSREGIVSGTGTSWISLGADDAVTLG